MSENIPTVLITPQFDEAPDAIFLLLPERDVRPFRDSTRNPDYWVLNGYVFKRDDVNSIPAKGYIYNPMPEETTAEEVARVRLGADLRKFQYVGGVK